MYQSVRTVKFRFRVVTEFSAGLKRGRKSYIFWLKIETRLSKNTAGFSREYQLPPHPT